MTPFRQISIHALLAESDLAGPSGPAFLYRFLSTLSLRRATEEITTMNIDVTISIHALLAESDSLSLPSRAVWIISIHALLAESDGQLPTTQPPRMYFYPRSPCGERLISIALLTPPTRFLSTLSLRRATWEYWVGGYGTAFLSTLSLRRATWEYWVGGYGTAFLSTLSLRRATSVTTSFQGGFAISIHALLAESDLPRDCGIHRLNNFYPRSPCGERLSHQHLS